MNSGLFFKLTPNEILKTIGVSNDHKKAGSVEPTYSVWKTLSKIDCSDKAESKNGLTYLSWAWAWGILMENYPQATYDFLNEEWDKEDRCTVWCKVRIGELERPCGYPSWTTKTRR